jgi:two-component system cell cycle response regulator
VPVQKATVLIVDDHEANRDLLGQMLEDQGFAIRVATDGAAALAAIAERPPDLVLLDVMMPGVGGLEVCRCVRARADRADLPIILVSAQSHREATIQGLDAGANDYVQKPFDPPELLARVRTQLRLKHLQDELHAANERLRDLATSDPLTGLANHRRFYERLTEELTKARRYGHAVACAILDLDEFKHVNDRYGHLVGDAVLCGVAETLRAGLRAADCAARYGGEEFGLVLPHADAEAARSAVDRVRRRVAEQSFGEFDPRFHITVSGGVAASTGGAETAAHDLVAAADEALYRAKHGGRNRVEVASVLVSGGAV